MDGQPLWLPMWFWNIGNTLAGVLSYSQPLRKIDKWPFQLRNLNASKAVYEPQYTGEYTLGRSTKGRA